MNTRIVRSMRASALYQNLLTWHFCNSSHYSDYSLAEYGHSGLYWIQNNFFLFEKNKKYPSLKDAVIIFSFYSVRKCSLEELCSLRKCGCRKHMKCFGNQYEKFGPDEKRFGVEKIVKYYPLCNHHLLSPYFQFFECVLLSKITDFINHSQLNSNSIQKRWKFPKEVQKKKIKYQ